MTFYKVWATRVKAGDLDGNAYVGQAGRLFYDDDDQILRISDGITPGGIAVNAGAGGGNVALNDITDVSVAGAVNGQILQYNGTQWVPAAGGAGAGFSVSKDSTPISANIADINFQGNLVTVTASPTGVNVVIDTSSIPSEFIQRSFETLSKNLGSYPYVINYNGEQIANLVYTAPGGTITKTLNYSGQNVSNIVITSSYIGETYTKTLSYSGSSISSVSYTVI